MKSAVVEHLEPEFEPVAVVWADDIPDGALSSPRARGGQLSFADTRVERFAYQELRRKK